MLVVQTVKFTVPLVPPSVNHYKVRYRNGRTVVSKEAIAFKGAVALFIRGEYVQAKRFSVTIRITLGKGDRGDWDNFPKLVGDGLAAAGAFRDLKGKWLSDAHVRDGRVILDCDTRPECGFTEITIEALPDFVPPVKK